MFNLEQFIEKLLSHSDENGLKAKALDDFANYCAEVTGIVPDTTFSAFSQDAELPGGVAINAQAAAQCVTDYPRTIQFITAVYSAIQALLTRDQKSLISLLYAGSGPYATLLLPILSKLDLNRFQIEILDIHPGTLSSVKLLLEHFGLNHPNISLIQADACTYTPTSRFDLIFTETMQKALEQEPQVTITNNLANYMASGGIFIPQKIEMRLWLANWNSERLFAKEVGAESARDDLYALRIDMQKLIELDAADLSAWQVTTQGDSKAADFGGFSFSMSSLETERSVDTGLDLIMSTELQLFEDIWLKEYDSDLCLPVKIYDLPPFEVGQKFRIVYEYSNYPRFVVSVLGT